MTENYDIAVAGAGFSGLMVVANLMRRSGPKPRILWCDPESGWGFGLAYSTYEDHHLLNVRADKMGAFADGIDDFWRWLQKNHPGVYQADDFVPRMVYGAYLDEIRDRFAAVTLVPEKIKAVRRVEGQWLLDVGKPVTVVTATKLVIATGNPPIAGMGWPRTEPYVTNFWRWRLDGGSGQMLPADGTIIIVGAGLTAADAMLSLLADGYRGRIICVSPHGRMPEIHMPVSVYPQAETLIAALRANPAARAYLRIVRDHAGKGDWRAVIDALRVATPDLWRMLNDREKGRAMRHLWSRWNVRRHRMAPQIRDRLDESGQVEMLAGRLIETRDDGHVTISLRHGGVRVVQATKILNCTGPSYRKLVDDNPLLNSLKTQGFINPGPLGLGIATPDTENLYAIGTPLLGERLETTAVPELRSQAAEIARQL